MKGKVARGHGPSLGNSDLALGQALSRLFALLPYNGFSVSILPSLLSSLDFLNFMFSVSSPVFSWFP